MKTRFNTFDLVCTVTDLQRFIGMRVNQVYDIDNKTYLFKLQKSQEKCILLIESGIRIHTTAFEWPKSMAPSGFSMKMRKHLSNKRLEVLRQLGMDRIVDMQFGTGEAAYHVILELYDRGNIILTDYEFTILNVLRPHTEGDKIKFSVREKYPADRAHERLPPPSLEEWQDIFKTAKTGDTLKKILNINLEYGPSIIDHMLLTVGLRPNMKWGKDFDSSQLHKLSEALQEAERLVDNAMQTQSKGYIIYKREKRIKTEGEADDLLTNVEFHPVMFKQCEQLPYKEYDTFDSAVDDFFSSLESQKIDLKALQKEREAMKKLENVRRDHVERLEALEKVQDLDKQRAELITRNQKLVDDCVLVIQSALASQLPWPDIKSLVDEAAALGDPVASVIKELKLNTNHITLLLSDPYANDDSSAEDEDKLKPMAVDIDLDLTAFANAKRYYDKKRTAAKKQQKTIESQTKAFKSAEKKTKQTLKEVQAITTINKARKVFWFEKFFWFISSENYLVIGGRDQQQNEFIVKKYLRGPDIYVHADIHGASSVLIKNPSGQPVPPKTLNEAGIMAVCYSVAWEAKVITSAWWVHSDQVSKTAPTGEYLTTGSFMVRGKKNYLPPCHLIMGFGFLFKLEDGSILRHKDERRVRILEEEEDHEENMANDKQEMEEEIVLSEDDEDEKKETKPEQLEDMEEVDESAELLFPDTEIRVEHSVDNKVTVTSAVGALNLNPISVDNPDDEQIVFLGDNVPVLIKTKKEVKKSGKQKKEQKAPEQEEKKEKQEQQSTQSKRGQKGKLKKLKEKYKDQDEEERQLKMFILQSAGSGKPKETKKGKKGSKQVEVQEKKKIPGPKPAPRLSEPNQGEGEHDDQETEPSIVADVDMLDSLTGQPCAEDELLFAVPVVAPYNVLTNYKYKVKLTPGTGKRGKASKTALSVFLRDRNATTREKDLLKSVKDQNLAQNLPGKVKVSAPQLQKYKK